MGFAKLKGIILCCIRNHNYCIVARFEPKDELKKGNGFIEVITGLRLLAPLVKEYDITGYQLTRDCTCSQWGKLRG